MNGQLLRELGQGVYGFHIILSTHDGRQRGWNFVSSNILFHFLDVGGFQGDHAEVIRASQRKVWVETTETASGPLTAMAPLVHSRAQPPVLTQRERLSSACSLWKETFP